MKGADERDYETEGKRALLIRSRNEEDKGHKNKGEKREG